MQYLKRQYSLPFCITFSRCFRLVSDMILKHACVCIHKSLRFLSDLEVPVYPLVLYNFSCDLPLILVNCNGTI